MKLLFDHIWGNTTSYDLFYSFPLAQLEQGDSPDDMLEQGWTPTDTYFYHLNELCPARAVMRAYNCDWIQKDGLKATSLNHHL